MNLRRHPGIYVFQNEKATVKDIGEHIIQLSKAIPPCLVQDRCAKLLLIIHRLWKFLKGLEVNRERRMVGKRMILLLT
jgi:hypothetical protein